jgi:hypothetical protein
MSIVLDGSVGISSIGTLTGVTSISSTTADTPVILQDSSSNSNTCRAWVNFNGTSTVAIRADFNVSSITDNGTGDYTVNFSVAMPDANYCISAISSTTTATGASITTVREANQGGTNPTTALFRLSVRNPSFADIDMPYVFAAVFR